MQQKHFYVLTNVFYESFFSDSAASLDAEVAQNYQSNPVKRVSSRHTCTAKKGMLLNKGGNQKCFNSNVTWKGTSLQDLKVEEAITGHLFSVAIERMQYWWTGFRLLPQIQPIWIEGSFALWIWKSSCLSWWHCRVRACRRKESIRIPSLFFESHCWQWIYSTLILYHAVWYCTLCKK